MTDFKANKEKSQENQDLETKKEEKTLSFEEVMAANKANEERLAKERLKANESVKRSYRLKP